MNYIIWLIISALFFAFGEFLSKKFALNPQVFYIVLVLIVYSLGTLAWLPAILQKNNLAIAGSIWSVMSLLATVSIGILIFGERVSTMSISGMFFAVVAIVLLYLG